MFLPELEREDSNRLRVVAIDGIGRRDATTQERRHAKIVEARRYDADFVYVLRKLWTGERHGVVVHGQDAIDHRGLAQLHDLCAGVVNPGAGIRFAAYIQTYDAVGRGIWEGVHEHRIEDTEDGCGGSDAKGEGDECGERETRASCKLPQGIMKILNDGLQGQLLAERLK